MGVTAERRAARDNKAGSEEYLRGMKNKVRMYGRRAEAHEVDIDTLAQMRELADLLDEQTGLVARALNERGFSWAQIGDALGMERQNAHRKYAKAPSVTEG